MIEIEILRVALKFELDTYKMVVIGPNNLTKDMIQELFNFVGKYILKGIDKEAANNLINEDKPIFICCINNDGNIGIEAIDIKRSLQGNIDYQRDLDILAPKILGTFIEFCEKGVVNI